LQSFHQISHLAIVYAFEFSNWCVTFHRMKWHSWGNFNLGYLMMWRTCYLTCQTLQHWVKPLD
jgi:hypothetical protein